MLKLKWVCIVKIYTYQKTDQIHKNYQEQKQVEFVLSWFAQLIVLWLIKLCIIKSHVVEDK